jgi:hypothetical protein
VVAFRPQQLRQVKWLADTWQLMRPLYCARHHKMVLLRV